MKKFQFIILLLVKFIDFTFGLGGDFKNEPSGFFELNNGKLLSTLSILYCEEFYDQVVRIASVIKKPDIHEGTNPTKAPINIDQTYEEFKEKIYINKAIRNYYEEVNVTSEDNCWLTCKNVKKCIVSMYLCKRCFLFDKTLKIYDSSKTAFKVYSKVDLDNAMTFKTERKVLTRVFGLNDKKIIEFDFKMNDLKSINIYYDRYVEAIEFNTKYRGNFIIGSKDLTEDGHRIATSMHTINLSYESRTLKIIGIELRSGHFLDSIKFYLKDELTNTLYSSPMLGGTGGRLFEINSKSIIGFKEITRIFGTTTNGRSIRSIVFEHTTSVKHGNPNCDYHDSKINDLKHAITDSSDSCYDLCKKTYSCTHYTWNAHLSNSCHLKSYKNDIQPVFTEWFADRGFFSIFCGKV